LAELTARSLLPPNLDDITAFTTVFEHIMFGEYDKLEKTLKTERYPNKFTNGPVISDDTAMAELDCTSKYQFAG